jgi:hypothetical protein
MIKAMTVFTHGSLLEGVPFGKDGFLVLSCWCLVCCYMD